MKIHFLGTCSGTEPMPGRHHCSLIVEQGDYYWFDAGEGCAYAAHTRSDLNPRKTRALFVSHPHIDHIGGLANLFFALDKNGYMHKQYLTNGDTKLDVFFPDHEILQAILKISPLRTGSECALKLLEHPLQDGELYQDENVSVSACHNQHLGIPEDGIWRSFSFQILGGGKKVVYSGDVKSPEELSCLMEDGCDVLIMETGHHKVADVCNFAKEHNVRTLCFNHHGREILNNLEACQSYVAQFAKDHLMQIYICHDGMTLEV